MQHLNYFTLRALAIWLHNRLAGGRWVTAFSQQAQELVILAKGATGSENYKALFLRVSCDPKLPYCAPSSDYKRARNNTVNLFAEIEDTTLISVRIAPHDRVIIFELENDFTVYLKLHGNRSNVLLAHNKKIIRIFRTQLVTDFQFHLPQVQQPFPQNYEAWQLQTHNAPLTQNQLKNHLPLWDKIIIHHVLNLKAQQVPEEEIYNSTWQLLLTPTFYVTETPPALLLLKPVAFVLATQDVSVALEKYLRLALGNVLWEVAKQEFLQNLQTEIDNVVSKADASRNALQQALQTRNQEEIGHLILAHLHAFTPGLKSVTIPDFYLGGDLTLSYDGQMPAQQLAAQYYERHKQLQEQKLLLQQRIALSQKKIEQLKSALKKATEITDATNWNAFKRKAKQALSKPSKETVPFRVFQFQNYTIWVGRTAANNDLLTVQYAKKDDLWLHARDVSGSHVVVRKKPGQKTDYPIPVIEYAAGLAAWFSKQRNNTLATVTYSLRKYVRKNKKMAVGEVIVDREKTLLVPPVKPPGDYTEN